jgi:hypothetical protein
MRLHWCYLSPGRAILSDMWWDDQVNGTSATMLPAVRDPNIPAPAAVPLQASTGRPLQVPPADPWQWWWQYSLHSARRWMNGIAPPVIDMYGPVLDDDEDGLLETEMTYSRLYGGDGRYRRSDFIVVGRPAVMVGALAASAVVNHRRKVAARREAEVCWRDAQPARVWATTHRLVADTTFGLVSFHYDAATEFYPDLDNWNLTLGFDESCPPLRLSGPAAPAICLWAATAILGDRWLRDPRLARLVA